ncbi:MAG: Na+/H+ antiporter subunit E [Clostridia bacterium]|nr:Na+/H+ antiporter subunit E [Clostridia bacterium]
MFFLLFGFWLLLNGRWTGEIALTGAVVCGLIYIFTWKFMGYSPRVEWQLLRRLPRAVGYGLFLIREVALSVWQTIRFIWSPKVTVQPEIVSFHTKLKTDTAKVLLANSITLTPGTITVDFRDDVMLVHCLDESLDAGLEGSQMEEKLMKLEGGK